MLNRQYILECSIIGLLIFSGQCAGYIDNSRPSIETSLWEVFDNQTYVKTTVILRQAGGAASILEDLQADDFVVTHVSNKESWICGYLKRDGLKRLQDRRDVLRIYKTPKTRPRLSQSIPVINASRVWALQIDGINITGEDQTICVVDTGVNRNHPDLTGKVIAEHCFCDGGCCPNGNNEDSNATDGSGHGTHVAGIAAANGALKGVAQGAKIVAIRVTNDNGIGDEENLAKGIEWCVENRSVYNISVITTSIGLENYFSDHAACDSYQSSIEVNDAVEENVIVAVASGNTGNLTALGVPACATNATAVAATYDSNIGSRTWCLDFPCTTTCRDSQTSENQVACFSSRASILDLLAPGSEINSTNITGWREESGTSMAAPHVAGAAALVIQYEKLKNNRTLKALETEARLKETGRLIFDSGDYSTNGGSNLTFPQVDAYAALFPVDVYDFNRLESSSTHNVFGFKAKNNYNNKTKSVNWTFEVGDGLVLNNTLDITLLPKNSTFVYIEYNYSDGDIYELNASATSGENSDSETMTLTIGDLIAYDLKEIYVNSLERIFSVNILNNVNQSLDVNWTMYLDVETIKSDEPFSLGPGNETFLYFHYNYTSGGEYSVVANATSVSYSDSEGIAISVTG